MCKATVEAKADLGVIFDTDVDRGGAVDSTGTEINRNRLVALASVIALQQSSGWNYCNRFLLPRFKSIY